MEHAARTTLPGIGPSLFAQEEERTEPGRPLIAQEAPGLLEPWMLEMLRARLRDAIEREEEQSGLHRISDPFASLEIAIEDPELEAMTAALDDVPDIEVGLAPQSESNFYAGFDDRHPDGLFVATYMEHPIGTPLRVGIVLPDGARIHAAAFVEWVRPFEAALDGIPAGLGVRLAALSDLDRMRITRFTRVRKPYFYEAS
jgi:hypothetical protein